MYKEQDLWKILVSRVCCNLCGDLTPALLAGNTCLGTSLQSIEFISAMTRTVSLHVHWDSGQPLCCGSEGCKCLLLFNCWKKLVRAAAVVSLGSSRATPWEEHTTAHFLSNRSKAWAKIWPFTVASAFCFWTPPLWMCFIYLFILN